MCEPSAPKAAIEIPGVDRTSIGSLLFVTTYKYYLLMVDQLQKGVCPFCEINREVNNVLNENDSWKIWANPVAGKKNQALHLVIPCNRHITHVSQLTNKEGSDLIEIIRWACSAYSISGGGVTMRFGDPLLNAGTIRHLHGNIQVPDGTGKLEITLAKDPEKMVWHRSVIRVFEKMRRGTPFDQLEPEEQNLVEGRLQ